MLKKVRRVIAAVGSIVIGFSAVNFGAIGRADFTNANSAVVSGNGPAFGDANLDGIVSEADAVLIMQALSNPDKYGLGAEEGIEEQGVINADVYNNGDGITASDALAIQKLLIGKISSLPESYKDGRIPETTTTTTTTTITTTTTTTTKPTTTSTTSTTTTKKPTTTSTTSTTTTKKSTTTSTTTTTTTTKPTTTSTTTTTTTTKPTTTSTTTTTTTTKPTTTSTTTTTTTTKPTTTSTTTTTTTTKPTTTSTTTTTTTTKPTTTSTTTTSTTTSSSTTTTSSTTSSSTTTSGTTTTTTGNWQPPKKEELVHDNKQIDDETYNNLLATANLFNIKEYKIIWSDEPIIGAYTDPGSLYCMNEGLAYGYGVQIVEKEKVLELCPTIDFFDEWDIRYSDNTLCCFRPIVPADSEERVLESFENEWTITRKSDGIIIAQISDLLENDPYKVNDQNPFNYKNWYIIPTENGEPIDEPINSGEYNTSAEPGSTIEYWFTPDELNNISRYAFYGFIKKARQLHIPNMKFDYAKLDVMYGFMYKKVLSGALPLYNADGTGCAQLVPGSDVYSLINVEKYCEYYDYREEYVTQFEYWWTTLDDAREFYSDNSDIFYTAIKQFGESDTLNPEWIMIPLTEDGEEDLRLYWPIS